MLFGSGFGGSVSARRLTEKGYSILSLEKGKRFNRPYREDVLDAYLFDDLQEVRRITENWLEIAGSIMSG